MPKRIAGREHGPQQTRLNADQIARLFASWPADVCDLALELRDFVLDAAPEVAETIAFHALWYYRPGQPYGVIGGNVCVIGPYRDCLRLGFIHGASLPDPDQVLQGEGKAKRHIDLRRMSDLPRRAVRRLIRAAVAHSDHRE